MVQKTRHDRPPKCISFNRRMHLILQRRTLPTKEQKMKQKESRELRNLSMNQLNDKLSELYKELPIRNPKYSFERPYRNHLLRQINQIKYEQTLRGKGLRSQGVWIESGYTHQGTKSGRFSLGYHSSELSLSNLPKEVLPPTQIKP